MAVNRTNQYKNKSWIQQALWFSAILIIWEITVRLEIVNPILLPAFSDVIIVLIKEFISGEILIQLINSFKLIFGGLVIGCFMAIIMSYMSYFFTIATSLFDLLSAILHPLPGIALLPLFIIWVGVGESAILVLIIHAVVWPMYINMKLGLQSVDNTLIEAAHNNGASRWQLFQYVLLPQSTQALLAGISIGWSRAWRGLISAEMVFGAIGSIGGIGWFLYEKRAFMDSKGMFAGVLLVVIIGILIESLVLKKLVKKHEG